MPVTVAVVNDYPLVVAGVSAILEPYADRVTVCEVAINSPITSQVDVVLQDSFGNPEQPLGDPRPHPGPEAPRRLIFSWDTDPRRIRSAVDGGADGYISKMVSADELVDAIERVNRGERVIPAPAVTTEVPEGGVLGRWPGDAHGLTPRESEILALICQGLSNQEISHRAYIGVNTVKTYIRSAYRRIGVSTRAQAVIWGLSNGFEQVSRHHSRVYENE